jgi:hypothetical protein
MKCLTLIGSGACLSLPVSLIGFLILGKGSGSEAVIILVLLFISGLPWNLAVLILIFAVGYAMESLGIQLRINWESALFWSACFSTVVGSHINGILLVNKSHAKNDRSASEI